MIELLIEYKAAPLTSRSLMPVCPPFLIILLGEFSKP